MFLILKDEGVLVKSEENPPKRRKQPENSDKICQLCIQFLEDKKASNVVVFSLKAKSSLADYIIIASGTSQRHISFLVTSLYKELKNKLSYPIKMEGVPQCDWALLDTGHVIVHIFRPEVRAFYNLEQIWGLDTSLEK